MHPKIVALEFGSPQHKSNPVCFGYIKTSMSMNINPSKFRANFVEQHIPKQTRRVGRIAAIFLFLAS